MATETVTPVKDVALTCIPERRIFVALGEVVAHG